jgi:hypothetical protein
MTLHLCRRRGRAPEKIFRKFKSGGHFCGQYPTKSTG